MVDKELNELTIKNTTASDLKKLVKNLQPNDREELLYCEEPHLDPLLKLSRQMKRCILFKTVLLNDKVMGVFGVRVHEENKDFATLVALTTNEVKKYPKMYLKLAKQFIKEARYYAKHLIFNTLKTARNCLKINKMLGFNTVAVVRTNNHTFYVDVNYGD